MGLLSPKQVNYLHPPFLLALSDGSLELGGGTLFHLCDLFQVFKLNGNLIWVTKTRIGKVLDKCHFLVKCFIQKWVSKSPNFEQKIRIFQLCSSEPRYGHTQAQEPKIEKYTDTLISPILTFQENNGPLVFSILAHRPRYGNIMILNTKEKMNKHN